MHPGSATRKCHLQCHSTFHIQCTAICSERETNTDRLMWHAPQTPHTDVQNICMQNTHAQHLCQKETATGGAHTHVPYVKHTTTPGIMEGKRKTLHPSHWALLYNLHATAGGSSNNDEQGHR